MSCMPLVIHFQSLYKIENFAEECRINLETNNPGLPGLYKLINTLVEIRCKIRRIRQNEKISRVTESSSN